MRRMIVVAVREYQAAVKTKAFVISLVAMPVLMGGVFIAQAVLQDKVDISDKRVAVVDHTGRIFDAVAEAIQKRNEADLDKGGIFNTEDGRRKQVRPRFVVSKAQPTSDDPARVRLELSERVRDGELFAFVIVGPDVIDPPAEIGPESDTTRFAIDYHSNSPTNDDFRRWVGVPLNAQIQKLRLAAANLDAEIVRKATKGIPVANLGLVSLDDEGNITKAEETNELATIFVPMGLMMLMFMVINVGAAPMVHSALEEKMQRIAEVLLGSIPPFQLMMGKLIGMVGVSLTIAMVYLVGAFFAIHRSGYGEFFPTHLVIWFVTFQGLAVLMFGSLFVAIGAAVTDMKEAQSVMMPVMIVVAMPLFVWIHVVREPSSPMSVAMSLFPPATPILMTMRQAVPPGIPLWQPFLGILLVLLTTVVFVFAAGRIFRIGLLMQGKGANVGQMIRWVIRG